MASVEDFFKSLRISKENLQFSRLKLFYDVITRHGATDQNYFALFRFFRWQLLIVPTFIIFLQRIQKLLIGGGGRYPPPQADSVLKRPGEIGLNGVEGLKTCKM